MRTATWTSNEAAIWSSQSPPGFERQPASWPLPLRRALAERFPAHIEGGRFAPLVHGSSSDVGPQYALTDAWDSSKPSVWNPNAEKIAPLREQAWPKNRSTQSAPPGPGHSGPGQLAQSGRRAEKQNCVTEQ
jgi:hypothetical protein